MSAMEIIEALKASHSPNRDAFELTGLQAEQLGLANVEDNLLHHADRLTSGDRREAYDRPLVDFTCTAQLWSALITRAVGFPVTLDASMVPVLMSALKLSRLAGNLTHADSAVDVAGYMRTLEMVWEDRSDS